VLCNNSGGGRRKKFRSVVPTELEFSPTQGTIYRTVMFIEKASNRGASDMAQRSG
jgi:hypothetical protein